MHKLENETLTRFFPEVYHALLQPKKANYPSNELPLELHPPSLSSLNLQCALPMKTSLHWPQDLSLVAPSLKN